MATKTKDPHGTPVGFLVMEDEYYTDGKRLYRIVEPQIDCVLVENCSTLYTAHVHYDTIANCWHKVGKDS